MLIHPDEYPDITTPTGPMRLHLLRPAASGTFPGLLLYSEIYQVSGPIRRLAAYLAGQGFVVGVPEVYHEHEPAGTVLAYDKPGTERGNLLKITKTVAAFDSDAEAAIDFLAAHPACSGRLTVAGVCLGGHLAFRAAMDARVVASACFYATDIHGGTLGAGGDDSLGRAAAIKGELLMVWGRQDPHVPLAGRNRIRDVLEAVGTRFQWLEVNAQHAFLRDEGPRYDPALARLCLGFAVEMLRG